MNSRICFENLGVDDKEVREALRMSIRNFWRRDRRCNGQALLSSSLAFTTARKNLASQIADDFSHSIECIRLLGSNLEPEKVSHIAELMTLQMKDARRQRKRKVDHEDRTVSAEPRLPVSSDLIASTDLEMDNQSTICNGSGRSTQVESGWTVINDPRARRDVNDQNTSEERTDDEDDPSLRAAQRQRVEPVDIDELYVRSSRQESETIENENFILDNEMNEDAGEAPTNTIRLGDNTLHFDTPSLISAVEKCLRYAENSQPRLKQLAGTRMASNQNIAENWAKQTLAAWHAFLAAQSTNATDEQKRLAARYKWYTYAPDDPAVFEEGNAFSQALDLQRDS